MCFPTRSNYVSHETSTKRSVQSQGLSTVFVALLPTTVETVNLDAVITILTFYCFGGHVLVGHRYPSPFRQSLINRKGLLWT